MPLIIKKYHIDILHSPVNVLPILSKKTNVITIHDISFVTLAKGHKTKDMYQILGTSWSVRKAEKIIATSNETIKEIKEAYKIPDKKIIKIYDGVDKKYTILKKSNIEELRKKYNLPEKYILSISTLEPRKNYIRQIRAFKRAKEKNKLGRKWGYVIVGGKGWKYESIINEIITTSGVRYLGFVEDEECVELYNYAKLFLYCSLKEGFGLPILEAMACGCPVITSKKSSMTEIAGNAAIKVNPYKIKEIEKAISLLAKNEKKRRKCIEQGLTWAKKFSWEATAKKTINAYKIAYAQKNEEDL